MTDTSPFPRVSYSDAGRAQRQATRRAQKVDERAASDGVAVFSRADWKVLLNVFAETTTYSRLADVVERSELAAGVSERQASRSLRKFKEHGVIGYVPGLGAGNRSVVAVPPEGEKVDGYLSTLQEAFLSSFPPVRDVKKSTESAGKRRRTRARVNGSEKPRSNCGYEGTTNVGSGGSSSSRSTQDHEVGEDHAEQALAENTDSSPGSEIGARSKSRDDDDDDDRFLAALEKSRRERERAAR